jgi:hypothetical protein
MGCPLFKRSTTVGLLNLQHCVITWHVTWRGVSLLCRMLPKCVSSTWTVNRMCCTSLLWLSLLPEAVLQHLFILNTIIWTYHQRSCVQYAFRSLLVMLPVFDIMYCLWESFGSGRHSCESLACVSALVSSMLYLWLYWFMCSAVSAASDVQLSSV